MISIDLGQVPVREANERIRALGAEGENIEVINPDARHHIGVGLIHPVDVLVRGSAGYFCAGLSDQARFTVERNVGWGLGDNMYSGSVVVHGNAGAIPGVAIRGAEIVVHGNMGSRAGQVMKAGTLACVGNANFMAGYMMYGGRIIILGDSGEKVGEDMSAGEIFVGGKVQDLGSDAMLNDIAGAELDAIKEFLDRYEISHKGSFQKVVNAGKNLRYGSAEPQVRNIPFFAFSGNSSYWNEKVQEDVFVKSQTARYRIRGYGGARALPHLADLAFRKDLSRAGRRHDVVSRVAMYTEVGGINGANPLRLTMPVMIAPMSYGALSASTKRAVGLASTLSGIAENTGEGGMSNAQRDAAKQLIFQCLGGRLGWNISRHEPGRRPGNLHFARRQAGLGWAIDGQKGHPRAGRHPRHPFGYRPAITVAPPGHPGCRRPGHQGRRIARGDWLPITSKRQTWRGPRAR